MPDQSTVAKMGKKLHQFRMEKGPHGGAYGGLMYLDDKPLKGVQAMQLTMDVQHPTLAILNLVMLIPPPELADMVVDVAVQPPPKPEEKPQ